MCAITSCKEIAITEIPVKNEDNSWMYIYICWDHLKKVRKCKNCIDYYEKKNECRHPAPYQNAKNEKGPRWSLISPEEYCGQWKPRTAIPLKEMKDE